MLEQQERHRDELATMARHRKAHLLTAAVQRAERLALGWGWRRWVAVDTRQRMFGAAKRQEEVEGRAKELEERVEGLGRAKAGLEERIENYHDVVSRFERHDAQLTSSLKRSEERCDGLMEEVKVVKEKASEVREGGRGA